MSCQGTFPYPDCFILDSETEESSQMDTELRQQVDLLLIPLLQPQVAHIGHRTSGNWWILRDGLWQHDRNRNQKYWIMFEEVPKLLSVSPDPRWQQLVMTMRSVNQSRLTFTRLRPQLHREGLPGPIPSLDVPPAAPPQP